MKFGNRFEIEQPVSSSVYHGSSDIYSARFAREHAMNKAVAWFIYAQVPLAAIALFLVSRQYIQWYEVIYSSLAALSVGAFVYGRSLSGFTDDAREIIWRREMGEGIDLDGDGIIGEPVEELGERRRTILRGVDKNHHWFVDGMNLSETQIKKIAETALNTKTLTVNYLEKVGLTRQEAEMLRITLVNSGFAVLDDSKRVVFNERGMLMFGNNK